MNVKKALSKLMPLVLVICLPLFSYSQAPQGFTYQAVIRSSNGAPIAGQNVKLHILLTNQLGTITYYEEQHALTTTPQGLANITIGDGISKVGTLIGVPWQTGDVYIKVEVDPTGTSGYQSMGNPVKLQSVPFALFAENAKEINSPSNATETDPIFVVNNKAGQTVFAVYQSGVRMYVDDLQTKGAKGGFAVGGLTSKASKETPEYFSITPDSARIRVRDLGKGAKGGFAVGGLTGQGKGNSGNYLLINPENYFIGHESGNNITTGIYNSIFGYYSGNSLTSGSKNTFLGNRAGEKTTSGNSNVYLGNMAGNSSVYGTQNIFIGDSAGLLCQSGGNIIIGNSAGKKATGLYKAIFIGNESGANDISGNPNTFIGNQAGYNNTTGYQNLFIGNLSGYKNTEGGSNLFIGNWAGYSNTTGLQNLFIGEMAGYKNTKTGGNTFIGFYSAYNNTDGLGNTFLGNYTGYQNTTGSENTFIGNGTGSFNTTGDGNTFVGKNAGLNNSTGYGNTCLGTNAGSDLLSGNHNIFIGSTGVKNGSGNIIIGGSLFNNDIGSGNITLMSSAGPANEKNSNSLLIANSTAIDSSQALIFGKFDKKTLSLNATVTIGNLFSLDQESKEMYNDHIILPLKSFVSLFAQNPVTLSTTKAIVDGTSIGQVLILKGASDTNTITINDNANTKLGTNRTLGLDDTLMLIWNGSDWIEISFSNN